jgi:hypothetical protein
LGGLHEKLTVATGKNLRIGGAIAQAVSRWFTSRRPGFEPGSSQVGFVADKVALGKVFSEYFGFPSESSFHQILYLRICLKTE